jgi:hypothetical protein
MKLLSLVAALAAVGGARTARAEVTAATRVHDAAVLHGAPMSGPYETAFDEKCAEIRDQPQHGEATCKRVRSMRVDGLRVEVHRVDWADASSDYYVALHNDAGWFVSEVPLEVQTGNGHAGHYDVGTIETVALSQERIAGGEALSLQIRERWETYCDECTTERARKTPERSFATTATLVCGLGANGAPSCTAPLYTGDDAAAPVFVSGKLIARGVEVGEPTEYGQEWHDLADDDYAVVL